MYPPMDASVPSSPAEPVRNPPCEAAPSETRIDGWYPIASRFCIPIGALLLAVGLILRVAATTFPLKAHAVQPVKPPGDQSGTLQPPGDVETAAAGGEMGYGWRTVVMQEPGVLPGETVLPQGTSAGVISKTRTKSMTAWGLWLVLVGGLLLASGLYALSRLPLPTTPIDLCNKLYERYMVGVGYALLVVALMSATAIAGCAFNGLTATLFPSKAGDAVDKLALDANPVGLTVLLCIAVGMSVLGALFFVANALRTKRADFEEFSTPMFWSGLWYRLGEAVLFTIVFFLVLRRFAGPSGMYWLPVVALLLGMFVTSGERLVFGLAKRVFAAMETLVPISASDMDELEEKKPAAPTQFVVTRTAVDAVTAVWAPPAAGPAARSYHVQRRTAPGGMWEPVGATIATTMLVSNLKAGVPYEFRVQSANDAGEGDFTAPMAA